MVATGSYFRQPSDPRHPRRDRAPPAVEPGAAGALPVARGTAGHELRRVNGAPAPDLVRALASTVAFGDILVHDDTRVDPAIVIRALRTDVADLERFRDVVRALVQTAALAARPRRRLRPHTRPDDAVYPISGFPIRRAGKDEKSRSAVQSSRTARPRHSAATRASCTRGPSMQGPLQQRSQRAQ